MKLYIRIIFLILIASPAVYTQIPLEETLFENTEKSDAETLESLQRLRSKPPNINSATSEQLTLFPLFTDPQIRTIMSERKIKCFKGWQDFQIRTNLDHEIVQWLNHYFAIEPKKQACLPAVQLECRERIQSKFPKAVGFQSGSYQGNTLKYYQRARITIGNYIESGLLFEKDPGEKSWNDHQIGYISINTAENRAKIVIGHYRIQTGMGLVLWGPYGTGKSLSPAATIPRKGKTIRGYLYADENQFFTGAALEMKYRQWTALTFYSDTRKDAHQDSLIRSFTVSGLHRTESERSKNKNAHEKCMGGRIAFETEIMTLGCTGWRCYYSTPLAQPDPIRQTFGFFGRTNHVVGFDWSLHFKEFRFQGETARSQSGGYAWMAYLLWIIKPVQWMILYRNFSPDFQNPYAQGFGYGKADNEQGFYLSGRIKCSRRLSVSLYMDLYRTPWRTYLLHMPETKSDFLIQGEYRFSSACRLSARIKRIAESIAVDGRTNSGRVLDTIQDQQRQQIRMDLWISPKSSLRLRSRLELLRINRPEITGEILIHPFIENGFLCFQEIRYRMQKKWTFHIRWASFATDSYDSRIYMFENDVPGILNNRPYYKKGTRWYALIQYHWKQWMQLSVKYGLLYQDGETSWGSGLDEIPGDIIKDLGIQIDIRL